ncbi:MAG: hypothetical protein ACR2PX_18335 [Endozoicomonas sp.]|uniref:hypothetical protein n=1 Tax=Endozoicomonas sp. TaxID=1892382 RepID=UPI003D9B49E2
MNISPVGKLTLSQIIERKLSFLLKNDVLPFDGDSSDLGERDALQQMLEDSSLLSEKAFETKYLAKVAKLNERAEAKDYSVQDNDDYYESFSNTIVMILELVNPLNLYDLEGQ